MPSDTKVPGKLINQSASRIESKASGQRYMVLEDGSTLLLDSKALRSCWALRLLPSPAGYSLGQWALAKLISTT